MWDPKKTLGRLFGYMSKKDGTRFWMLKERYCVLSLDVLSKIEVA